MGTNERGGTLIGGVGGGALGAMAGGGDLGTTALGAGAGAVVGNVVGRSMDDDRRYSYRSGR